MQKALSLDEINRDIRRFSEQEESFARQRKALEAARLALWIEDSDTLRRNSSQYTLGPHRLVMANAIYQVLKEERPLDRRTILTRVIEKGVLVKEIDPLKRVSEILTADERLEKVRDKRGFWTLAESCQNDLTAPIELSQEIHTQNETAKGWNPSAASTKREVDSPMDTVELITHSQSNNGNKSKAPALLTALGPDDPDDGDTGRQQRGIAIAAVSVIKKTKVGYSVVSQSGNGRYVVNEDATKCECPDFELRDKPCKHIRAVEVYQMREENPAESPDWTPQEKSALETETVVKKPTPKRNWKEYNEAQVQGKANVREAFEEAVRHDSPAAAGNGPTPNSVV